MDNIVVLKNISKSYKKNVILNHINVNIKKGSIYGLIGENGAGKTTLIKVLTGILSPDEGTINFVEEKRNHLPRISAVVDEPAFFNSLTVEQNLIEHCKLLCILEKEKIAAIILTLGLEKHKDKLAKNLSLGLKQRLAIALALIGEPDLVVLDEPLNGLDPEGIMDLRNLILNLHKEKITVLVSSHILSELEQIATDFGILKDGRMIKEFSKAEIIDSGIKLEDYYLKIKGGK